jgi:hypothetical protein
MTRRQQRQVERASRGRGEEGEQQGDGRRGKGGFRGSIGAPPTAHGHGVFYNTGISLPLSGRGQTARGRKQIFCTYFKCTAHVRPHFHTQFVDMRWR